jgi:hypothetical protein
VDLKQEIQIQIQSALVETPPNATPSTHTEIMMIVQQTCYYQFAKFLTKQPVNLKPLG